jgi:hypothetical protein
MLFGYIPTLKGHTSSMDRDLHPTARDRRPSSELDPMENVPDVAPQAVIQPDERNAAPPWSPAEHRDTQTSA